MHSGVLSGPSATVPTPSLKYEASSYVPQSASTYTSEVISLTSNSYNPLPTSVTPTTTTTTTSTTSGSNNNNVTTTNNIIVPNDFVTFNNY